MSSDLRRRIEIWEVNPDNRTDISEYYSLNNSSEKW